MCETLHTVFIGIGSNLGDREAYIDLAIEWLAEQPKIDLVDHTNAIETEPWGVEDQPRFLNAVARIKTGIDPISLLKLLKEAEYSMGRRSGDQKWGPREIDLDILIFGSKVLNTDALTVPHQHLTERPFVLRQIVELDQETVHPVTGSLLSTYLD